VLDYWNNDSIPRPDIVEEEVTEWMKSFVS